jgi:GH18 family chitinase
MDIILDFYSIMTYNYHGGSWEEYIGHNAPLYAKPGDKKSNYTQNLNIYLTIKYLLSKGTSKEKIVMGLSLYGSILHLWGQS